MAGMACPLEVFSEVFKTIQRGVVSDTDPRVTARIPKNPGTFYKVTAFQRRHDIHKFFTHTKLKTRRHSLLNHGVQGFKAGAGDGKGKPRKPMKFDIESDSNLTSETAADKRSKYTKGASVISPDGSDSGSDVDQEGSEVYGSHFDSDDFDYESEPEVDERYKLWTEAQKRYKQMNEQKHTASLNAVHKQLDSYHMDLRYTRMKREEFKVICTIITTSCPLISRLDLTECMLDEVKVSYLCDVLLDVNNITDLILAGNQLGFRDLKRILRILRDRDNILYLDLSENGLKDDCAHEVAEYIEESAALQYLILKNNYFSLVAGKVFGKAIGGNYYMQHLDISWNNLRKEGARQFIMGCAKNHNLQSLNLSWNGLRESGAAALRTLFLRNSELKVIYLVGTGLDRKCLEMMMRGLKSNTAIEHISLYHNPLMVQDISYLLKKIMTMQVTALSTLDLGTTTIAEADIAIIERLDADQNIYVKHGNTTGSVIPGKVGIRFSEAVKLKMDLLKERKISLPLLPDQSSPSGLLVPDQKARLSTGSITSKKSTSFGELPEIPRPSLAESMLSQGRPSLTSTKKMSIAASLDGGVLSENKETTNSGQGQDSGSHEDKKAPVPAKKLPLDLYTLRDHELKHAVTSNIEKIIGDGPGTPMVSFGRNRSSNDMLG